MRKLLQTTRGSPQWAVPAAASFAAKQQHGTGLPVGWWRWEPSVAGVNPTMAEDSSNAHSNHVNASEGLRKHFALLHGRREGEK